MDLIPRERIVAAVRHLLDRPKMADMIIPDLARWEDWSVMDRLVQMFKDADEETNWLRVPVITYLRACPKPEAKKHIEELAKIDPDAVRRADFFLDFSEAEVEDEDKTEPTAAKGDQDKSGDDQTATPSDGEAANEDKLTWSGGKSGTADDRGQTFTSLSASEAGDGSRRSSSHVVKKVPVDPTGEAPGWDAGDEKESELLTNPDESNFVSTTMDGTRDAERLAQSTVPPVAAANSPETSYTLTMILAPFAISCLIFLLLWSVISGRFERLIF